MSDAAPATQGAGRRGWIIVLVVVLALAVGIGVFYWQANRKGVSFAARFTDSVGVYPGSDVRILGVPVGKVDAVMPQGQTVLLKMHLDPGFTATADTQAVIISPNLVSDRYVQLTGVYGGGTQLASGTTIPLDRTHTPVETDDLYRSLIKLSSALGPDGANKDGAFGQLIRTGAKNLKGNGQNFNNALKQFSQASQTLSGSSKQIFGTVDNLASFSRMLKTNNDSLITVNNEFASVSQTLSDDRQSFGAAMQQLSRALTLVQTFIHDNRAALSSNVGKLNTVAKTLSKERDSLLQAITAAPLLTQNFARAYDSKNNVLRGRIDLNEIGAWAQQQASGQSTNSTQLSGSDSGSSGTSDTGGPPTLLPGGNTLGAGGSGS